MSEADQPLHWNLDVKYFNQALNAMERV
jgi:hypothetical protein